MYARSTTVRGTQQSLDEGIAHVRDEVMPAVRSMEGCVGLSMLANRRSGRCIVTTSWVSAEAMRASADAVGALRVRAAELFSEPMEVQEWEIALLHRIHESGDGAASRVTWMRTAPERVDDVLAAYRDTVLPRLERTQGFCGVSVLLDRATGRGAAAVAFASREAMERFRPRASALRQEFARATGIEIPDVAEFDLALAHLRVPETV